MSGKPGITVKMLFFILRGLHSFSLNEGYTGDIIEEYYYRLEKSGKLSSFLWLLLQTIRSVPGSILFNFYIGGGMFKNYTTTALRNIKRQKGFTLINITGLATGLACCLLIFFYVSFEYSYDNYHEDVERIYRINNFIKVGENEMSGITAPYLMAATLMDEFPDVECATKFYQETNLIKHERFVHKESVTYVDSNYFKIFSLQLIEGNKKTTIDAPYQIILSKNISKKLFGDKNPIGKAVTIDNNTQYTVTGIFEKVPENSDYRFEVLASMPPVNDPMELSWLAYSYQTFIKIHKNADPDSFNPKLDGLIDKYIGPEIEKFFGKKFTEFKSLGNNASFSIQPILEIHMSGGSGGNSEQDKIIIISSIGAFILLLACINYINLSTAHSLMRSREIGVRKVLGSMRKQIVLQFLTESLIITIVSLAFAVGMVELSLPFFNELIGKEIITNYFNLEFAAAVFAVILFVGILAGLYPALLMSGFKPVDILRNKITGKSSRGMIRKALVIFQFITSITLISGTLVVSNQLSYIQNKNLGYQKDQVLILNGTEYLGNRAKAFKSECLKLPEITNATISGFLPTASVSREIGTFMDGNYSENEMKSVNSWNIDYDYIETMGINLKEGRNFSKEFSTDSNAVIINEALVNFMGWENPFEHQLGHVENIDTMVIKNYNIIGVVQDFHFKSLRNKIAPLAFYLGDNKMHISFKFKAENVASVIDFLQNKWDEFNPGHPFSYQFMDESFSRMYGNEVRTGKVFGIFSFLAILIACLGLFGLSSYTAQRKTKEIGIRKVHGASVKNIVILLTREFVIYVSVAFVISVPLAYYFMDKWLQDFAYRSELNILIFILSGLIALMIALATVSYQAVSSALINPAHTLKYE